MSVSEFLASMPMFSGVPREQLDNLASSLREMRYKIGDLVLTQGETSDALYILRSGHLAVRVNWLDARETVALLQPPAIFGELSMITGKTCSADVEVVVDANVLVLPHVAFDNLAASHGELLRGMVQMLGERLHTTNVRGAIAAEPVVTLLRVERSWAAPAAFSDELGRSLARQMNADTLVVTLGDPDRGTRPIAPQAFSVGLDAPNASAARAVLARALTQWRSRFPFILLNLREDRGFSPPDVLAPLANITGELLGAGAQPVLTTKAPRHFVVSSERGGLPWLSGARQIARDAAESERRYLAGEPTTAPFRRTVDSIARHIAGVQVGLALGGGAAWGLAHIGVLAALERSGVPVDVVSGCSMGSVVGAMRCAGHTPAEMVEIAETLGRKKRRFVEPRIWQLHLLSEREVRKMLLELLEDRALEELELPLWMNTLDLATAEELSLKDGPVWEAVRAAIAMPGLLPPLKRGNRLLVDAGFIDPVPVSQVRSMGCRYAIAVNAMQPPGAQKIIERYPFYTLDVLYRCLLVAGYELGEARCRRVADVVIEPRVGEISWLAFHRTHELVHAGERAAEAQMSSILGGYERLKALCLPVWSKN